MEVQVKDYKTSKILETFKNLPITSNIGDVKVLFAKNRKKFHVSRQSLRENKDSKTLPDNVQISTLRTEGSRVTVYFKDLGPQIGWRTVFLIEYTGPLIIYILFYYKRELFYSKPVHQYSVAQQFALYCWCGHYVKRLLETLFVHKFSHQTMPFRNLLKNCSYYWGFAALIAYFHNHELYTPPIYGDRQLYGGLAIFILSELGNFSIHWAFKKMRPTGTGIRKIPYPGSNPFTWLFGLVSCPNYSYEVASWFGYSFMSQSLPALIFTLAGFGQMTVWALAKHRAYKKEFPNYPRSRRAIIPLVL